MASNCIIHKGGFNKKGHGTLTFQGKSDYAHRVVLKKKGINLGSKDLVHHTCHNKACVNEEHLKVVNWANHSSDHNRGENNSQSRLTDDLIREIRRCRIDTGLSYSKIGKKFSISKDSAVKICNRKTWRHVA